MPKVPYNKRKDGRYYKQIIIGVDGQGKRIVKTLNSRKGESWQEFDKRVQEYRYNVEIGRVVKKNITFGECIDLWFKTQLHLSETTLNTYKSHLKKVSHLRSVKVQDLKPLHFRIIYEELFTAGFSGLINRLPPILNSILDFAVDNNFAMINIHRKVKIPKLKIGKRRALTKIENNAVLQSFNEFSPLQRAFVGLLYYTGMRRGEILALKVTDCDFEERYIYVRRTLTKNKEHKMVEKDAPKTEAGIRKIPLVAELNEILMDYIQGGFCQEGYLFLTKNGNLYGNSAINCLWKGILKIINSHMPEGENTTISPHYFRHNFATELAYSDIPMKTAQYILGHEHISFTMDVYADAKLDIDNTINALELHWNNERGIKTS